VWGVIHTNFDTKLQPRKNTKNFLDWRMVKKTGSAKLHLRLSYGDVLVNVSQ
jgi:hypothetical protein